MEYEAIYLKKTKEQYMGMFRGKKGKGERMSLYRSIKEVLSLSQKNSKAEKSYNA